MTRQDYNNLAIIVARMPYTDHRIALLDHLCYEMPKIYPKMNVEKFRQRVNRLTTGEGNASEEQHGS